MCAEGTQRERGQARRWGPQPGATLEQASCGVHRAGTLPSPNPGWHHGSCSETKTSEPSQGESSLPVSCCSGALMGVDRLVLSSHLVVPPQQPEDCLVTLPHPVGGHRRWAPVAYSLPGGLGVLLSRKGASCWPFLGSHTPGQMLHGMWLCPRRLLWPQTQEHISQPTLYTDPQSPPMLSSGSEDTFGGLQAATSPLPDSLALK